MHLIDPKPRISTMHMSVLFSLDPLTNSFLDIKIIQKACPKEETKGKFVQNWDYHLTRSKREFKWSLKNHLKQALIMLPKIIRSSSVVVFSSSKAIIKFPIPMLMLLQIKVILELFEKSSKIEYKYPQFCIIFAIIFRLETPPFDMTTKL